MRTTIAAVIGNALFFMLLNNSISAIQPYVYSMLILRIPSDAGSVNEMREVARRIFAYSFCRVLPSSAYMALPETARAIANAAAAATPPIKTVFSAPLTGGSPVAFALKKPNAARANRVTTVDQSNAT